MEQAGEKEITKMKELRFTEQYILQHRSVDLGTMEECSLPEEIFWDEEEEYFQAFVSEYAYKGWKFTSCELSVCPAGRRF
jgi:hypothetical protein